MKERTMSVSATPYVPHLPQTMSVLVPERFGGSPDKLRKVRSHLLMKIQGDSHKFPSDQHQLRYAIGLLTDQAFNQIEP